jgi:hypothetical protein
MTLTLQIAAVAALLIVGGLSALALAARDFDRRYPPRNESAPRD